MIEFLINLKSILHNQSDLKSAKIFNIKSKMGEMPPAENTNKYDQKIKIFEIELDIFL